MGIKYSIGTQYEAYGDVRPMLEVAKNNNINLISTYWDNKIARVVVGEGKSLPTPIKYIQDGIMMDSKTVYMIPFEDKPGSFLSNINKLEKLGYLSNIDMIYLGENNVMILVPKNS